jgi:hypothetical protein
MSPVVSICDGASFLNDKSGQSAGDSQNVHFVESRAANHPHVLQDVRDNSQGTQEVLPTCMLKLPDVLPGGG